VNKHKTVTLEQVNWLKFSLAQHEGWRGNHNPDDHDEFDEWTSEIKQAIKAVQKDRKLLRRLLNEQ